MSCWRSRPGQGRRVSDVIREALGAYLGMRPTARPTAPALSDTVSDMAVTLAALTSDVADMRERLVRLEEKVEARSPGVRQRRTGQVRQRVDTRRHPTRAILLNSPRARGPPNARQAAPWRPHQETDGRLLCLQGYGASLSSTKPERSICIHQRMRTPQSLSDATLYQEISDQRQAPATARDQAPEGQQAYHVHRQAMSPTLSPHSSHGPELKF